MLSKYLFGAYWVQRLVTVLKFVAVIPAFLRIIAPVVACSVCRHGDVQCAMGFQLTLNNTGLKCKSPLICSFFSNSKYYSTMWFKVGWILRCRSLYTEEPWILRDHQYGGLPKFYVDFLLCWGLAPLAPELFKGQLYIGEASGSQAVKGFTGYCCFCSTPLSPWPAAHPSPHCWRCWQDRKSVV